MVPVFYGETFEMTDKPACCCICGRVSDSCSSLFWEENGVYCSSHQGFSRLKLPWRTSDRGMTAEVVEGNTAYLVHALSDAGALKHFPAPPSRPQGEPSTAVSLGQCKCVERRLQSEGGPRAWLGKCTREGEAPCRSVSAPCVCRWKEEGEGSSVFLMLIEEKRDLEVGDLHTHIPDVHADADEMVSTSIDVEEFVRRKGCMPTDGREYLAAQQAARGVKLSDYTARSVWEIVAEEGGYVRDVLERRYRAVHAKRLLREAEYAAISRVAEEPPLEPLDLS